MTAAPLGAGRTPAPPEGNRTSPPPYWDRACRDLAARDAVIGRLIDAHRRDVLSGSGDAFRTVINAVVGQQISVAAAAGIWRRLHDALVEFTPQTVASVSPAALRAAGLSSRKAEYVVGIAEAFTNGRVDPCAWPRMDDEEIRGELTALRGIGPWTADMVLIFHVQRPDVLPLGDLGLVSAASRLYGWDGDTTDLLRSHAERWRPWRTVATWYIWRELDAEPVVY